jgi:arginine/lysine/ornithine decarboxylase
VLTGGAYLHIQDDILAKMGKKALSLFGSTSPSYLIMASLDKANEVLDGDYRDRLSHTVSRIEECKTALTEMGYSLIDNEPLKITIETKKYGYVGNEFADILRKNGIEVEFSDPDYVVMMLTTETTDNSIDYLSKTFEKIEKRDEITLTPPPIPRGEKKLSVREAMLLPCEKVNINASLGRVLADAGVGCPPAVPVAVCGEEITAEAIECFGYYGIEKINVVR